MAAVIAVLVFLLLRDTGGERAATQPSEPAARSSGRSGSGAFARAGEGTPAGGGPPVIRRNELGQPLNEDGRPIGPSDKVRQIRNEKLDDGELPTTPPLFDNPSDRAEYKKWWVEELTRRAEIYKQLEPGDDYPTREETEQMLDEFYDAAEPRAPGESVDEAYARRQDWRRLWKQFLDSHGATVQTVQSRGGDPQHGTGAEPPVKIPGVPGDDPEPAEPSDTHPPGRGPDDPGGTDPIEEDG
jgi:hypothetical protein